MAYKEISDDGRAKIDRAVAMLNGEPGDFKAVVKSISDEDLLEVTRLGLGTMFLFELEERQGRLGPGGWSYERDPDGMIRRLFLHTKYAIRRVFGTYVCELEV
jgi:hypothetical protein